ncbi:MAG: hypothetical protein E7272_07720 [Pseudobutyrivibrio ruminis]|uniref:Uncharacterized protein n=1 Tax=Pseudobutyrivibrio ruminis TaxID=46206 RepID=A0A927UC52_9FIRM|nr:hypothetical protein [Pseudobutyrivibrio ruminis]
MRKLNNEDVEIMVDEVTEDTVKIIAFVKKDTCMDILDEEFSAGGWSVEYKDGAINGHFKVCKLGVKQEDGTWTYKESTGMVEMEGNEKHYHKLVEANAFKRACKVWGIGKELNSISAIEIPIYENVGDGLGDYDIVNHEYKYMGKNQGSFRKTVDVKEVDGEVVCVDKLAIKNLLYHTEAGKETKIGFFRIANLSQNSFIYTFNELNDVEQKELKIEEIKKAAEKRRSDVKRLKVIEDFEVSRQFEGMDLKPDCGSIKIQNKTLGELSDGELALVYSKTKKPEIKAAARNGCQSRGIKVS